MERPRMPMILAVGVFQIRDRSFPGFFYPSLVSRASRPRSPGALRLGARGGRLNPKRRVKAYQEGQSIFRGAPCARGSAAAEREHGQDNLLRKRFGTRGASLCQAGARLWCVFVARTQELHRGVRLFDALTLVWAGAGEDVVCRVRNDEMLVEQGLVSCGTLI